MNHNVLFSIIVPFYKGNDYINQIFEIARSNQESLAERFPDASLELLLVNDSPKEEIRLPEDTGNVSFQILTHEKNSGIHQARVTGLLASKGDFILFLDQDDEVASDCLADQYAKIGDADMIIACAYYEEADGSVKELYDTPGKRKKLTTLQTYLKAHDQIASPGQCLIRRTSIPKEWTEHILEINGSDDFFLWMLMFEKGMKFAVNPRCLYTHKYTGANLSESDVAMSESSIGFARLLKEIPYVSQKHVDTLVRSREFDIRFQKASPAGKVLCLFTGPDLIMHRLLWKIKCL